MAITTARHFAARADGQRARYETTTREDAGDDEYVRSRAIATRMDVYTDERTTIHG